MPSIEFLGRSVDPLFVSLFIAALAWVTYTVLCLWVAYFVLKLAIKHGIQESGLVIPRWADIVAATKRAEESERDGLPTMRAER